MHTCIGLAVAWRRQQNPDGSVGPEYRRDPCLNSRRGFWEQLGVQRPQGQYQDLAEIKLLPLPSHTKTQHVGSAKAWLGLKRILK